MRTNLRVNIQSIMHGPLMVGALLALIPASTYGVRLLSSHQS